MWYPKLRRVGGVDNGTPGRNSATEGCRYRSHGVAMLLVAFFWNINWNSKNKGPWEVQF